MLELRLGLGLGLELGLGLRIGIWVTLNERRKGCQLDCIGSEAFQLIEVLVLMIYRQFPVLSRYLDTYIHR